MRLTLAVACLAALACEPAVETRARGQATAPPRLSIRGTIHYPEEFTGDEVDRSIEPWGRQEVVRWAERFLPTTDESNSFYYLPRFSRVRSHLPLERPRVDGPGARPIQLILEAPVVDVPARPLELHESLLSTDDDRGPRLDVVVERAAALPPTRAFDSLWSDGILEIAVVGVSPFEDAREYGFAVGEALERWKLHLMEGRETEGKWRRRYAGLFGRAVTTVRAEIQVFYVPRSEPEGPRLMDEEQQAAYERREQQRWDATAEAFSSALGQALATRDLVIVFGDLDGAAPRSLEAFSGPLLATGDQVVLIDGGDPEAIARRLALARRAPGRTLWVAGADGSGTTPVLPLELLGSILVPRDPSRAPSLDEMRWELADRTFSLHEIVSEERP